MTPPIHDITDPGQFLPGPVPLWHTWWFWLILTGFILLSWLGTRSLRNKTSATRQRRTLLDRARKRLAALKVIADSIEPETAAVRISLILRSYLEAAFEDPALFETNEEFTLRPHVLARLQPDCRGPVSAHLKELYELKYHPGATRDHITGLIDQTDALLVRVAQDMPGNQTPPPA